MTDSAFTHEQVIEDLRDFVEARDQSMEAAGRLEIALDFLFPEDEAMQDVVLALASYRPGGGEFLYDEYAITKFCRWALAQLEATTPQKNI